MKRTSSMRLNDVFGRIWTRHDLTKAEAVAIAQKIVALENVEDELQLRLNRDGRAWLDGETKEEFRNLLDNGRARRVTAQDSRQGMIHVRQKHELRELEWQSTMSNAHDAALEYAAHYDRRTWSHSVALGMRTLDLIVRVGETEREIRVRGKMAPKYEVVG